MSHNALHPWFRDKRQAGGWGDPKGLEGGGTGSGGGSAPFTFPPTPPTDGAPEPSGHEYNMAVFLHPDPSGVSGQDMKPVLSSQQKQREGKFQHLVLFQNFEASVKI